jgi:ADP-heptose:LPS heptosyltransferase
VTRDAAQKILVIQLTKMGDFLQTTPLLAALKRDRLEVELTVLVPPGLTAVARGCPAVDRILTLDLVGLQDVARRPDLDLARKVAAARAATRDLTTERFDRVINLNYSVLTALLAELIPAENHVGYHLGDQRQHLLREEWTNFIFQHMTDRRLVRFNLVDVLLNYAPNGSADGRRVAFEPLAEESCWAEAELGRLPTDRPLWGLQIGTKNPLRRWPVENFVALAEMILDKFPVSLVLTGTADEGPLVRAFLSGLGDASGRVLDLTGRTSLGQLAAVLERLDRLVTGDTGTMHLAAARNTPVAALFMGPAHCHETGPYGQGHLILQAVAPCFPCQEADEACGDRDCRQVITPDLAAAALAGEFDPDRFPKTVVPYRSELDGFGVVYRPLIKRPLDAETALALALREAGRRYLRPGYRPDPGHLEAEIRTDYLAPEGDDSSAIQVLAANLGLLRSMIRTRADSPEELAQGLILAARGPGFSSLLHPLVRTMAGRLRRRPGPESVTAVRAAGRDAAMVLDLCLARRAA